MSKVIRVFTNCKTVKGIKKAAIIDLQRNKVFNVSHNIIDFIHSIENKTREDIFKQFENQLENCNSILIFLLKNEICYELDENFHFPELNMKWKSPHKIQNAIIDLDSFNYIQEYNNNLRTIKPGYVLVRVYNSFDVSSFIKILEFSEDFALFGVELLIPFSLMADDIISFLEMSKKIYSCVFHNAKSNDRILSSNSGKSIITTKEPIKSVKSCGIIKGFFSPNIQTYSESIYYNSCLNRKISIDADGNIKNCPSMSESFGNIKDTTLADAIEKPGFKKFWKHKKDDIKVCQDCEFRYICTDCRAYLEDPHDEYSKPLKCGYDPYTGEWSEWSTNPLKQKAIRYYGMEDILE